MKPPIRGEADQAAFIAATKEEIDQQYKVWTDTMQDYLFREPPEGWGPTYKLTRRDRLNIFAWRVRGWLAAPLVWVLRWLYPGALAQDVD